MRRSGVSHPGAIDHLTRAGIDTREPTPPTATKPTRSRKLRVTERQALQVVREVAWAYGADPFGMEKTSMTVLRDFDREGDCLVIWEEGPPSWSYYVPNGGDYEGLGLSQVPAIRVPKGVRVEAKNHCSIALYREA